MTPEEIDTALSELSNRMERVRALYEQYFMGIERLEPTIPRKDLDRRLEALRKTPFQNTAKRFKFQTLIQRYTALQQYWYRTCRDIENGTYRKHIKKAQRRFENDEFSQRTEEQTSLMQEGATRTRSVKEQAEADMASLLDSNIDLTAELGHMLTTLNEPSPALKSGSSLLGKLSKAERSLDPSGDKASSPLASGTGLKPLAPLQPLSRLPQLSPLPRLQPLTRITATSPRPLGSASPEQAIGPSAAQPPPVKQPVPPAKNPVPVAAPAPAPALGSSLSEDRIRAIHAQYQHARAETKASAVSYEKLEKNLRETEAQLRATHQGKNVDFEVAIKDGKAILKPRLK